VDAAIAVQMVLTLVEPQSSGIGGGAFLLHWDGRAVQAWDGRETAPAAATPQLFLKPDGQPMRFGEAVASGLSVGVPGTLRMLEAAHRQGGRLPWARLMAPAIALADNGFEIGPRLHALLQQAHALQADPAGRAFYYQPAAADEMPQPWPVGHRLRNPALAEVLRRVAHEGATAFYQGTVARAIVQRVQGHAQRPGRMREADLAGYQAVLRQPLCTDWQRDWRVCGMGPPSSGQLTMMQILGLLDALPARAAGAALQDVEDLHRTIEASRLAFADRALYIADPAFVLPPAGDGSELLTPAYLHERSGLIGARAALGEVPAGQTQHSAKLSWAPQAVQAEHGTSHISVVDAQGHAVAMTSTIEGGFGSGLLCDGGTGLPGGFMLNNELTDFSLRPNDDQGRPVANRVEAGKRPRSSMSPTLVFNRHTGALVMSLGSPGGAAIIPFTMKVLRGTLEDGLTPQAAMNLPNVVNLGLAVTVLEQGRFSTATLQALRARGHALLEDELPSGAQALQWNPAQRRWLGGADPRREGVAVGE
jgi:gamma-glutamyltranspeptidase/glutathione hydrolase